MKRSVPVFCLFFVALQSAVFAVCPFCDPSVCEDQSAYEDSLYWVFVDRAPCVPGHLLVVPKRHVTFAQDMTQEEWSDLHSVIPKVVQVFQKAYGTDQYLILQKNGPFAGQTVPHVHFHMLPMQTKKLAEDAKAALFSKIFNQLPKRLTKEEIQAEVSRLRPLFKGA